MKSKRETINHRKLVLGSRMHRAKLFFTFWGVIWLNNFMLLAQLELKSDSNHVETGNLLALQLRFPATMGKPDTIQWGTWSPMLPEENIVAQTEWESDGLFFHKTLNVLFFEEDSIELPPLPLSLKHGHTVYSNPLFISVTATPSSDDLNDMAPIKDIHREPTYWTDYWPWYVGGVGVLAIIGLLYWMASKKPKNKLQSRAIEIPAHERALKKLDALMAKKLTEQGLIKEHYAELTYILRAYLEARFGVPALESTTDETLDFLSKQSFPEHLANTLRSLLEQADLAKFAKTIPPASFHAESFVLAKKLVMETSLMEEPPITD